MNPCHLLPFETLVAAAESGPLLPGDLRHLDQCAGCRGAVRLLRDQAEALRQLTSPAVHLPLRDRILRRARHDGRERLVQALRSLLREASRAVVAGNAAPSAKHGPDLRDNGSDVDDLTAGATKIADLLFEVATLDRRLSQLGDPVWPGGDLGGLAGARPTTDDLARRTLVVLEQLEQAWAKEEQSHQPTATPSFRDSLAPR